MGMVRTSILSELLGYRSSGAQNERIANAQNELLICMTGQPVDEEMIRTWSPIAGNLEGCIARFLNDGLLEEASVQEKLDKKYRVNDLKALLEGHDVKAKGKKSELISLLIEINSPQMVEELVSGIRLYKATDKGRMLIDSYLLDKQRAREIMEVDTMDSLLKQDLKKAVGSIMKFRTQMSLTGKDIEEIPALSLKVASKLLSYKYDELTLNEKQRREIGAQLALSALLCESLEDAGERLLRASYDVFSWETMIDYLKITSLCYCSGSSVEKPEEMAELYAHKYMLKAQSEADLESLSSAHIGRGVKIFPAKGSSCLTCYSGKSEYLWSELDRIPAVPGHLGCHCKYVAWI